MAVNCSGPSCSKGRQRALLDYSRGFVSIYLLDRFIPPSNNWAQLASILQHTVYPISSPVLLADLPYKLKPKKLVTFQQTDVVEKKRKTNSYKPGAKFLILSSHGRIHLIPKWQPINYSFGCMLISHLCLINMYEKTKEFWSKNEATRAHKHATKRIIYWLPFWNKV